MARYQVILAYDGTHFHGYQRSGGVRTIQGEVEQALCKLDWQQRSILSAGRTDTGVHASGQVIAFDLNWDHSPEKLKNALNAFLPDDIAVNAVRIAAPDFHPRFHAKARCYHYRIYCKPDRNPLCDRFAWKVWPSVNGDRLKEISQALLGTHDFRAFGSPLKKGGTTVREVFEAGWIEVDDEWQFRIKANAFLYHMVRRLVYLQVMVGQDRWRVEDFIEGIQNGKEQLPGLAEPNGLVLVEVQYE
ncbi:MAG: tRNA pseudouridine(38-40) synthase TruA [Anaerolineaceae bacterium]